MVARKNVKSGLKGMETPNNKCLRHGGEVDHSLVTIGTGLLKLNITELPVAKQPYQKNNCRKMCGKEARTYCFYNPSIIVCSVFWENYIATQYSMYANTSTNRLSSSIDFVVPSVNCLKFCLSLISCKYFTS